MRDISQTLSAHELSRAKILIIGLSESLRSSLVDSFCSLNCHFISSDTAYRAEAEKKTPLGTVCQRSLDQDIPIPDETVLAIWRRWFWSSKIRKSFVLEGFPSTIIQARVLDEWLETREQTIDFVFCMDAPKMSEGANFPQKALSDHYRNQGVLVEFVSTETLITFLQEKSVKLPFAS